MGDKNDLRSAIELLKTIPGGYVETDVEADPDLEIASICNKIGGGGTLPKAMREGPACMFNNVKGYKDTRFLMGALGRRKFLAGYLNTTPDKVGTKMLECVKNPIPPIMVEKQDALCQEVVHLASEPGFDLMKILPMNTTTAEDAGPAITMGLCRVKDPETGASNASMHRMFYIGKPDELSILADARIGRHAGLLHQKAEQQGKSLPVSISIGLDPLVYVSSVFSPPTAPLGCDELGFAGALRNNSIEVAQCLTVDVDCIARSEYVIEGELLPNVRVPEDEYSHTGMGFHDFLGYNGPAHKEALVLKVTAITHRINPIFQACLAPGEEHVNMAGLTTEACIFTMLEKAYPTQILNVYAHPSGGGKFLAIIQFRKLVQKHEGTQRQAALLAFAAFHELKHVILVDEDIDIFDTSDVMWALNTRFQADIDIVAIPNAYAHATDPSAWPEYNPLIRAPGATCKAIFDCTVPFNLKYKFQRPEFVDVDVEKYFPGVPHT